MYVGDLPIAVHMTSPYSFELLHSTPQYRYITAYPLPKTNSTQCTKSKSQTPHHSLGSSHADLADP